MKKYFLFPLAVVAVVVAVRLSLYTVDAAEYVYVTVLGQPVATFDGGAAENGAGLKVGWPWPIQQAQRLDRRLQIFDLPEVELLTNDPTTKTIDKMLLLKAYVCWRISDAARRPRGLSGRSRSGSALLPQADLAWRRSRSWRIGMGYRGSLATV